LIHINWLPYWTPIKDYASSRLRCFFHHQNLNQYHSEDFTSTIGINPDLADKNILIVTQKMKDEDIQKVIDFKNRRKDNVVIYDIVDNYYTDNKVKTIFKLCDYIVVANEIQRQLISKHINKKIFVLEDCIDYEEQLNSNIVPVNNNICWFGNNTGLNNIRSFLLNLLSLKYNINIIGKCNYYKRYVPGGNCIEWEYNNFIYNLRNNSFCLLTHDLNQQQKSNNKLLVCIANGVPVISYQSKSYDEILRKFGLDHAIIYNRQDLINAIKTLSNPEKRQKYFEEIQPYILENFNSQKITKKLINIFAEIDNPNRYSLIKNISSRSCIRVNKHEIPKSVQNNPTNKKILLYTANFGNYDLFNEIQHTFNDYLDYVYITDTPRVSKTWDVRVVKDFDDPYMTAKMYKILPHRFFPEYDISIWIDASAKNIHSCFLDFIKLLINYNFIITKHPSRTCVYDEANICIKNKKDDPDIIQNQINTYNRLLYPKRNGLYQCGFLIRKHLEIQEFSENWWNEIINNSKRDQISFPYIYNQFKHIVNLKVFNPEICKEHFNWRRHGNISLIKPVFFRKRKELQVRR
jgi:hypothetical protein